MVAASFFSFLRSEPQMRFTPQLGRIVLLGFLLLGVSAGALAETAAPARIDGTVVLEKSRQPTAA